MREKQDFWFFPNCSKLLYIKISQLHLNVFFLIVICNETLYASYIVLCLNNISFQFVDIWSSPNQIKDIWHCRAVFSKLSDKQQRLNRIFYTPQQNSFILSVHWKIVGESSTRKEKTKIKMGCLFPSNFR